MGTVVMDTVAMGTVDMCTVGIMSTIDMQYFVTVGCRKTYQTKLAVCCPLSFFAELGEYRQRINPWRLPLTTVFFRSNLSSLTLLTVKTN